MPIILTKAGVINKKKQSELKDIGYVVIETDKPEEILVLDETPTIDGNMVLSAALEALAYGNDRTCSNTFGELIRKKMLAKNKTT